MSPEQICSAAFTIVGIVGGFYDLRTRRIPNWFTFPAMAAGLLLHGVLDGERGLVSAALAGVAMLVIILPFVLMRGMGMGDLKLLIATGISAGMGKCLWVMFFAVLINGAIAVMLALRKHCFGSTVVNTFSIMRHAVRRPFTPHPKLNLDNQDVYSFPFGVAVGLGCIVTVIRSGVIG